MSEKGLELDNSIIDKPLCGFILDQSIYSILLFGPKLFVHSSEIDAHSARP